MMERRAFLKNTAIAASVASFFESFFPFTASGTSSYCSGTPARQSQLRSAFAGGKTGGITFEDWTTRTAGIGCSGALVTIMTAGRYQFEHFSVD